jgi:tetratricopeptide (TPR) repeat protein
MNLIIPHRHPTGTNLDTGFSSIEFYSGTFTQKCKHVLCDNLIGKKLGLSVYIFLFSAFFLISISCQDFMDKFSLDRKVDRTMSPQEKDSFQKKLEFWENDLSELEDEFQEKLKLVSKMGELSKKLATGYTRIARFELASHEFHNAIQYEAGVKSKQKIYKTAIKYYKKAFLYSVVDDDLLYQAALVYANASMVMGWEESSLKTAMTIFKGLLKKNPQNPRALFQRALLYYRAYEMPQKAIKDLKKLIRITPDDVPTYELLGHIYYSMNKPVIALRY